MKTFIPIFFIYIICSSFSYQSGNFNVSSKNRSKNCLPSNAASEGIKLSTDFGKSYGACSGFTCATNYDISGDNCIAAIIPNTIGVVSPSGYWITNMANIPNVSFGSSGKMTFHSTSSPGSCIPYNITTIRKYKCNTTFSGFDNPTTTNGFWLSSSCDSGSNLTGMQYTGAASYNSYISACTLVP